MLTLIIMNFHCPNIRDCGFIDKAEERGEKALSGDTD